MWYVELITDVRFDDRKTVRRGNHNTIWDTQDISNMK